MLGTRHLSNIQYGPRSLQRGQVITKTITESDINSVVNNEMFKNKNPKEFITPLHI
jgi:hypothetical protein